LTPETTGPATLDLCLYLTKVRKELELLFTSHNSNPKYNKICNLNLLDMFGMK